MNRPLNELEIENPCPKKWAELQGGGTRRYCGACDLHVTNLSAMGRSAAQEFLDRATGRTCVTWIPDGEGAPRFAPEPEPVRHGAWVRAAAGFLMGLLPFMAGCREDAPQRPLGSLAPPPASGHQDPGGEDERLVGEVMVLGDIGYVDCDDAAAQGDPAGDR